jgi:putative chitinase
MILTLDQTKALLSGNKNVDEWHKVMVELFPKYDINTPSRIAGFIAQCGHESLNFTVLEENLNYSADGLNKIFPKYFKSVGRDAQEYHRQPEKIANLVYAGRMSNGDAASGDGWRFRGRGAVQCTGRANYQSLAVFLGRPLDELVIYLGTIKGALESACWYWQVRNINQACDQGDIVKMTKLVNGGTIGLEDRKHHYKSALNILGSNVVDMPPAPVSLRLGARGDDVAVVQRKLGIDPADGIFGEVTKKRVVEWQYSYGLTADGIIGPKTMAMLLG